MRNLLAKIGAAFLALWGIFACLGPTRTNGARCQVIYVAATNTLQLIPVDSESKAVLDAMFADAGALTTVALTQVDAVRSGYGDASQPYKGVQAVFS